MVRLGILASEMEGQPTGVGRFVEGLLTGLARIDFDGEVHLFFQGAASDHPLARDPRFRLHYAGRRGSQVVWEQLALPRHPALATLDLFCGPAYSLPPRLRCPTLVAIHDLSFELLPAEFVLRERWRRRLLARRAARRATRVLTLTRHVAREIEELYGVAADRIDLLPLAVDVPHAHALPGGAPSSPPPTPPYALYLGSILPRRRLDLLLEAFARVARDHPDLRLVIAGANRLPRPAALAEWIDRWSLRERVAHLGWVPEPDRRALLSSAVLSFYVSTYEGYGLPPLESLAAGTPAVVSTGLGLDDLLPDYPYRCAQLTAAEIERVTRLALDDVTLRQSTLEHAMNRVRALSWEATARCFLESTRRAIAQRTL